MGDRNLKAGLDSTVFKNRKFIDWLIYNILKVDKTC